MRKLLLLAALAAGGTAGVASADGGHSFGPYPVKEIHDRLWPHSTSVTWPSVTPPGWYTNTYRHQWYQPWYAYYNFSSGPYANWAAGGGYAGYSYHGPAGVYNYNKPPAEPYIGVWYKGTPEQEELRAATSPYGYGPTAPATPSTSEPSPSKMPATKDEKPKDEKPKSGNVSVTLPTDAKLLFNGVASVGAGGVRTFATPPLAPGQSYQYQLTAEVTRDGRTERATETVIVRAGETAQVTLAPSAVLTAGAK
ncbi:TIGR03000 domain-containing protein [Frigoriglobus tundricola]|uniref:TIGR03000 domain-containing protein n=1 Tax=Frigoriglobus tundricola TaxID=2774151 RepID=A0A6M5YNX9_9BACT|nr:TIGR03000 domain-containing protein [Frigoriglobus tundricola]QJW95695.1 hypothetical protein FTUN_3249 [Frigoriglobus tundricola]